MVASKSLGKLAWCEKEAQGANKSIGGQVMKIMVERIWLLENFIELK